jgi:hypothetical protein
MNTKKKVVPRKHGFDAGITRAVRFQNSTQIEAIKQAAARRGWSFNAFIVRVVQAAVQRELEAPPVEIFGVPIEALDREAPSD